MPKRLVLALFKLKKVTFRCQVSYVDRLRWLEKYARVQREYYDEIDQFYISLSHYNNFNYTSL